MNPVNVYWRLNSTQYAFVNSPRRFSFYVGGIAAGKTYSGAVRAILAAVERPGSLGFIGAPTYPMLRDATQRAFFELLPRDLIETYHKQHQHLTLANGSEILFRSLDAPDHARGLNLAWFWLDEAPLCGHYAWTVLKGRLRQKGFTTSAWATGTPHGRDGYWHDFESAPRPNHALFRAPTHANALNLPPDFIAELGYTGAFYDQEVLGLFTAFEGLVYTFDASPQGHLRDHPTLLAPSTEHPSLLVGASGGRPSGAQPPSDHPVPFPAEEDSPFADVVGGIDWGYTNPTAAVVFGIDGDGRAWQLDEFYQRRAALDDTLLPAVVSLTRRYGVSRWYCGPDEPEHIAALAAALRRERLSALALPAENAVRPGIQTVTSLLALRPDGTRGLYIAPRCVHTIAEYACYQYTTADPGQRDPSEQPLKQSDHCVGVGTPVMTSTGERAIETVQAGDLVLTRKGYRRVLAAGCTNPAAEVYCVEFSNGAQVVGTGNHRVWVVGRGWVPIDALRYRMHVETACIAEGASCQRTDMTSIQTRCASDVRSSSFLTALRSVATPLIPATARGTTMRRGREIARRATNRITGKSGSGRTGRYRRGITSTTLTGTRSTTIWRILNVCQERSTYCAITVSGSPNGWQGSASGLRPSVLRLRPGMGRRKVGHGTRGTARRRGRVVSRRGSVAITAALSSSHETGCHGNTAIARTNAGLLRDGRGTRMMRR